MSGRSDYECCECRHRFRAPEDAPLDMRTLMCPACGSIDLSVQNVTRPAPPVLVARPSKSAERRPTNSRSVTS